MTTLDASKFLEDLSGRYARLYRDNLRLMVAFRSMGDREQEYQDARDRLREVIRETLGVAEVLGASQVLRHAARVIPASGESFLAHTSSIGWDPVGAFPMRRLCRELTAFADTPSQTLLPSVSFLEAIENMVDRTPVTLKDAAERTATRISQLYSQGQVVAFAKSAEDAVTEKAQEVITKALSEGIGEVEAGRELLRELEKVREVTDPWADHYAKMAFRTNLNTATTAGRFKQAADPDVQEITPAFQFDAVGDSDTRDNHAAADGLIFTVGNPVWRKLAPPLGYNCRCQVNLLTRPQLRRMGRLNEDGSVEESTLPAGAGPDEGFRHGGRPDLAGVG